MTENFRHEEGLHNPQGSGEALLKTNSFELLTGKSNPRLARDVANILGMSLDEPITIFDEGEIYPEIKRNIRNKDVFIIQSTVRNVEGRSVNDAIQELVLMSRAAKRASAHEITAVIPYYGYGRQDRKDKPRVTISAADVARQFKKAGVKRILTVDLHAEQVEGAINGPWDNIYASREMLPIIKNLEIPNLMVVSPDIGGSKRARKMSTLLGGDKHIAIIDKQRGDDGVDMYEVIGKVKDKNVLIVDDVLSSGGTITQASERLKEEGALKIYVAVAHGLFTKDKHGIEAIDRIDNSCIDQVFVTDTIELNERVKNSPKITVITIAPLLAEAIKRIHTGESVSELIPKG